MLIPVINHNQFLSLSSLPILAVDMGFSGKSASSGYAYRAAAERQAFAENKTFADCLQAVAGQIDLAGELILIIEAPLSAAFDRKGNPQPRGAFESNPRPRWWSLGPGAAMSLAAMHFLKRLVDRIAGNSKCHLVEGYVVGANSGHDADVAIALIQSACSERKCRWQEPQGEQLISVVDWVQPAPSTGAFSPIVLIPEFQ
jgi:hypothetical protein